MNVKILKEKENFFCSIFDGDKPTGKGTVVCSFGEAIAYKQKFEGDDNAGDNTTDTSGGSAGEQPSMAI